MSIDITSDAFAELLTRTVTNAVTDALTNAPIIKTIVSKLESIESRLITVENDVAVLKKYVDN